MVDVKTMPDEEAKGVRFQNKMFRLAREAVQAFDILKAKQGARSGPRLMAEAVDLLLEKYGEQPVGFPPHRPTPPIAGPESRPKATRPIASRSHNRKHEKSE